MGLLYKSSKLLKIILDILEDQEGGAMYISCDASNGGPVEPETGYVPNNPLFGLSLDSPQQECAASCVGCLSCQGVGNTTLPISALTSNDFDCGACFDPTAGGILLGSVQNNSQVNISSSNCINNTSGNTGYWSTDEMASTFPGLPPLDIDPLPSLFPFSPCGASYNFATNPHQASLSYTVHPHQMLVSPTNTPNSSNMNNQILSHDNTQISHHMNQANSTLNNNAQSCYYDPTHTNTSTAAQHLGVSVGASSAVSSPNVPPPPPIYPSMSVNVSMNMTMHGYGSTDAAMPMQCPQMQWTPPNSASSVNVLYPPVLSSTHYPAATYSITADFRGPGLQSGNNQNTSGNDALPSLNEVLDKEAPSPSITPHAYYANTQLSQSYTPPDKSPNYTQMHDTKSFGSGGYEDEDSNDEDSESKPNLCRLCGKTYARPSTLKTHLRTHSGERPYRCPDCNKSFSQAANLTAHVRTHTGQKPFRCPICDRRFSQSSSVTTHMRTHSGERPYRCSSCKKSFSDSSTLTKHLRIHSGEKPYQCKLCLLRFSQSGNLNRHMRVHGGNNNGSNNNNNNSNNLIT